MAFQSDRDEKSGEIYLMNLKNKKTTRLTNNNLYEESPCFSSNGKKMLFTRQIKEKKDSVEVNNGEIEGFQGAGPQFYSLGLHP